MSQVKKDLVYLISYMHCYTKLSDHKIMKLSVWCSGNFSKLLFILLGFQSMRKCCLSATWGARVCLWFYSCRKSSIIINKPSLLPHLVMHCHLCLILYCSKKVTQALSGCKSSHICAAWSDNHDGMISDICCLITEGKTQDSISKPLFLRKKASSHYRDQWNTGTIR